ncbi:MAG: hypothetical protein RR547_02745 [Raoultibacter sp.]
MSDKTKDNDAKTQESAVEVKTAGCGQLTEEEVLSIIDSVTSECKYLIDDAYLDGFISGITYAAVSTDAGTYGWEPHKYLINGYRAIRQKNENPMTSFLGL